MKTNIWRFMVVIVFLAGLMISNMLVQAKENTPVIQWEYKTERIHYMKEKYITKEKVFRVSSNDLIKINELGKEGWELCASNNYNYYFKREIRK